MAKLYAAGDSSVETLRPSNPTEPLHEELLKLLFAADGEHGIGKAHNALSAMLETYDEMNEKTSPGCSRSRSTAGCSRRGTAST